MSCVLPSPPPISRYPSATAAPQDPGQGGRAEVGNEPPVSLDYFVPHTPVLISPLPGKTPAHSCLWTLYRLPKNPKVSPAAQITQTGFIMSPLWSDGHKVEF